jgi:hypothetical protein
MAASGGEVPMRGATTWPAGSSPRVTVSHDNRDAVIVLARTIEQAIGTSSAA